MLARDGTIWAIPPDEQVAHTSDDRPFEPYSRDELSKRVLAELPQGFRVHRTTHYLIFYDTSPAYAQWCGSLFERLYMAFTNYWTPQGLRVGPAGVPAGGHRVRRPAGVSEVLAARSGRGGRIDHRLLRADQQPDDDYRRDHAVSFYFTDNQARNFSRTFL